MKIKCVACKSAFTVVAFKGDKSTKELDVNKIVTRCPVCTDVVAYALRDVPVTERDQDDVRIALLDEVLWPMAATQCARGQKLAVEFLMCAGCPVRGALDTSYCDRATERHNLLLKVYGDAKDQVAVDDDEETVQLRAPEAEPDNDMVMIDE